MKISSQIKQGDRGKVLIDFLEEKFKYLSREEWIARLNEGRFSIDTEICSVDRVLQQGEILVYDAPPFKEPDADLNYKIEKEFDDFLVINKPGNLLVHKKGAAVTHNLIYQLRECHDPQYPKADIVNRLDKETSGIVLVSKNKDALRELTALFMEREVEKVYYAVVLGTMEQESGTITASMRPNKDGAIRSKQVIAEDGKAAETRFELLRTWDNYSLVKLFPKTGRTHQLRLHMAHIGFPMVGDKFYSLSEEEYLALRDDPESITMPFHRQALHCGELRFTFRNEKYVVKAPIADDMRTLIPDSIIRELSLY